MPSNNSKYTEDFRQQTAKYVLENDKSATAVAKELGIDKNTVCRWVREYRRNHNMPSYAEERNFQTNLSPEMKELILRQKKLEKALKKKEQEIAKKREEAEILKKVPTHVNAPTREKCEAIYAHSTEFSVRKMCKVFDLLEASYYQWRRAEGKRRIKQEKEQELAKLMKEIFEENGCAYGKRRMKTALAAKGIELSDWTIQKIMRENGMHPIAIKNSEPD